MHTNQHQAFTVPTALSQAQEYAEPHPHIWKVMTFPSLSGAVHHPTGKEVLRAEA